MEQSFKIIDIASFALKMGVTHMLGIYSTS